MNRVGNEYSLVYIIIAKQNTDLKEMRKQWFSDME